MGGMDFSNLDKIKKKSNENVERVSGEVVTISNTLPESVSMGATGGAVAILPIIDKAINLLDTGLRCYAMVQVEREKTKQVKYQSEAVINAAEQRTKQVKIQEKEITKRCKLECEKEVNLEKIKLLQLREQLKNEEKQSENSYKLWMSNLEKVERAINNLLEQKEILNQGVYLSSGFSELVDSLNYPYSIYLKLAGELMMHDIITSQITAKSLLEF
mgnify:CR=1 FL=1